ncbi:hypothetical protein C9426_34630 [Serratia sp. S1B]|nr:hypothetical protein C9426_34630 [Serratia sp. S1B]
MLFTAFCHAQSPTTITDKPSPQEAKDALQTLFEFPPEQLKNATVQLGTCVPALGAPYEGITCTTLLKTNGGTSESQADFYRDPKTKAWKMAAPSADSQEKLPFPDPKFQ